MLNSKKDIRNYIYNLREEMKIEDKEIWDREIYNKLIAHKAYENAKTIFIYVSFKGEVDTHSIINKALSTGKKVCIPMVNKNKKIMEAYYINSMNDLHEGYFGIMEPKEGCKKAENENIDLIISPGVAFDIEGGRIGYGGGFYDKFIASLKENKPIIALAYKFQILDKIILEDRDKRVDEVISNN